MYPRNLRLLQSFLPLLIRSPCILVNVCLWNSLPICCWMKSLWSLWWGFCPLGSSPRTLQAGQIVSWRFVSGLVSQSFHLRPCLVKEYALFRLHIPHYEESLPALLGRYCEVSIALSLQHNHQMNPSSSYFSQYLLPFPSSQSLLCPVPPPASLPVKSILFPLTIVPLNPLCCLSFLDLWTIAVLFLVYN